MTSYAADDTTARMDAVKQATELAHDIVQYAVMPYATSYIVTAAGNAAYVWDSSGKQLHVLQHADRVISARCLPDGTRLLTTSDDHTARVWDFSGKQLHVLQHQDWVHSAQFS